jgi:hypothetical protein
MKPSIPKPQWLDWINEQKNSPLSIAAFCRQKGINADNFYYHRKQTRKAMPTEEPAFVKAQIKTTQFDQGNPHEIIVTCGLNKVYLPRDVSPQWLAQFMVALT